MEFKYLTISGLYLATFVLPFVIGQTLTGETLKQTFCDPNNVTLSCDSDSIIALENVQLGYNNTRCSLACCNFSIDDCIVNSTDIQTLKRICSGQSTCSPTISSYADFCNFGRQPMSYLYFEYFCLLQSRVTSVCSNATVDSLSEELLYVTNPGFPSVTTDSKSCSCSFEAESCSSSTTSFIIDADLYLNTSYCLQQITFKDSNRSSLDIVGCENYYNDYIIQKHFTTNYVQFDFSNNSTQNREGIFIIGFKATEPNVTLRINCQTPQPTWCIDCGSPDQPTNGMVILDDSSDTGYNATASITCNPGFSANATTITCKERGIWDEAVCTPIDCQPLPTIENGNFQLAVPGNYSFGASATVTCDSGYAANTTRVSCTETGTWEAAACFSTNCTDDEWRCISGPSQCINISKICDNNTDCEDNSDELNCTDCGTPSVINGNVALLQPGNTTMGASATVVCNNGYNASTPTVTCESDGLWTTAYCNPKDCGMLPDLSMGSFTLTSAGKTTYGSTATVTCSTGYESTKAMISCLENASWDTATCRIKDCGKLPDIENGELELAENSVTTYGATAKIVCDDGYYTEKAVVRCTDRSKWESVTCLINETKVVQPPNEGNSVIVIATVVPICCLALLQLTFSIVLHRKIYQKYTEPGDKIANIILLSAVPILGIFIIASRWKALQYRKYKVHHPEHPENDRLHIYPPTTENGRTISAERDTTGYTSPTYSDERYSGYIAKPRGGSSTSSEVHLDQITLNHGVIKKL